MTSEPRYATVLFDLDGTLTDPRVGITRGVQHGLRAVGIEVDDPDTLVPYIGPPIHDGLVALHGVAPDDIEPAVTAYRAYYRTQGMFENELHLGIPELLADLRAAGVVLALATSKPASIAADIVEHFGLGRWFSFIGGATLDGSRRAKADIIDHTLEELGRLGPAPDRRTTVIVGDREHDVHGALAAGIASIGVRWGYASSGELEAAGADRIVGSVDELRAALLGPG